MNEFVARNGLIALDSSSISGPLTVSGSNLTVSAPGFYNTTFRNASQSVYNTYEPAGYNSWIIGVETDYFAVYSGRNIFYLNRSRSNGNSYLNSDYFRFGAADTATAQVDIAGSSTARASLRIRSGSAPTSPNDGDIWNSGSVLYLKSGLNTSGSSVISGSLTITEGITGSFFGTSSWAQNAATASSADSFLVRGTLTAQTIVVQTITSSIDFVTGSTKFGSLSSDRHQFTGSVSISGSSPLLQLGSTTFVGDSTNPAITLGSTSNGIYLDSNRVFFKAGGSFAGGFSSTGLQGNQIQIRNDFFNDLTTAMYIPYRLNAIGLLGGLGGNSAGDITLITSGSSRLFVSSSGNIGIGTTTPAASLDVSGSARVSGTLTLTPGASDNAIVINNGGYIKYGTTVLVRGSATSYSVLDSSYTSKFLLTWGGASSFFNTGGNYIFNGITANASAMVQIDSTTQGFLPPRMTTVQRDAIASPATGLSVYNTTTLANNTYNGTAWLSEVNLTAAGRLLLGGAVESTFLLDVSGSARVNGNMTVTGSIIATRGISGSFSGSYAGDGSQLTGIVVSAASTASYVNTLNQNVLVTGGVSASSYLYSELDITAQQNLRSVNSSGDEGGEIFLNKAVTNTTLNGGVTIDVWQNRLRFFEQGGTARGYYIDISNGGAGVSTNLVGGGGSTSPGGSNTQIQYNNGGAFGGVPVLTYDGTTLRATGSFTGSLVGSLLGTASFATTASSADNFTVRGTLTAQTIVAQTITSSTDYVSGSTIFGNTLSNTHQFTGSVNITGSLLLNGSPVVTGQIVLTAGGGWPSITSGSNAPILTETPTNRVNYYYIGFPDTIQTFANWSMPMPSDYNGGTITAVFYWAAGSASTNSVRWGLQARAFADSDALDQAFGTAQEVTDANQANDDVNISAATPAITIGGTPAASNFVQFRAYRNPADAADNLAATAELLSIKITYTRA